MVDRVKPLKLESIAGGGDEDDLCPTETDPSEDYLACKGVSFENLDGVRIEKTVDGYIQVVTAPTGALKIKSPLPLIIALG